MNQIDQASLPGLIKFHIKGNQRMAMSQAVEDIKTRIEELHDEAQGLVARHRRHLSYFNNSALPPAEQCPLRVYARIRAHHLEIYWRRSRTRNGSNIGGYYSSSKLIPKGRGHRYHSRSLWLRAKPWTIDTVLEIEEKMGEIRAEYSDLRKALQAIKSADKKAIARKATIKT
ncbi:MAG: hypothetical protein CL581_19295 [Alteromonadaceae bacterium]|nr:hypothetical protein [Alteromonadaceae bacterium]MBH85154.1 hypothetical protein [Alteromonadaceae bacterium]|tara:strand:+ start:11451 stop:11966 length:516 start_codon:yes stop_codon:yes gene_type:complete